MGTRPQGLVKTMFFWFYPLIVGGDQRVKFLLARGNSLLVDGLVRRPIAEYLNRVESTSCTNRAQY